MFETKLIYGWNRVFQIWWVYRNLQGIQEDMRVCILGIRIPADITPIPSMPAGAVWPTSTAIDRRYRDPFWTESTSMWKCRRFLTRIFKNTTLRNLPNPFETGWALPGAPRHNDFQKPKYTAMPRWQPSYQKILPNRCGILPSSGVCHRQTGAVCPGLQPDPKNRPHHCRPWRRSRHRFLPHRRSHSIPEPGSGQTDPMIEYWVEIQ